MPRVTAAHRASRRDQILDAALRCFAERGFHRTSMADIIAASGLSAGAIYLHFPSKQRIVVEAGRRVLTRRLAELEAAPADAPPDPVAIIRGVLAGLTTDFVDTRLIVQLWGEAATDPELHALVGEIFGAVGPVLAARLAAWRRHGGHPGEDARAWAAAVVPAVLSLAQGALVQRTLLPGFDEEAYFAGARLLLGLEP